MKKVIIAMLILSIALACKSKSNTNEPIANNTTEPTVQEVAVKVYDKILGSFVGEFGDNKISMLISKAANDSVAGRTVVGGNDRPFEGIVTLKDGLYTITAKEPGGDKHDGTFNITISESNNDIVKGSWAPFDAQVTPKKDFVLQRKEFKYRIDVGFYPQASQRILKAADVEELTKFQLQMMRNEIFARHGYCFKKKEMRDYFEIEDWYVPDTVDIKDKLTELEKQNITLIKKYEQYAIEYGDDFGR